MKAERARNDVTSNVLRRAALVALGSCFSATAIADPTTVTIAGGSQYAGGVPQPLDFPLSRSGDLGYDVALSYHTVDGTAIAGVDYTAASATIVVPALSPSASLPITVTPYYGGSSDLTFQLQLDAATGIGPTASFAAQQTFATTDGPYSVTAADINGDGKLDLIAPNLNNSTVSVLLNTSSPGAATPSFATQQSFATGAGPFSVAAADFNGDGKPDLLVSNSYTNTVSVLLNVTVPGAAAPAFAAQNTFVTGNDPASVTAADLNGDGKPDLIVANFQDNTISVRLNTTAPGAATPTFPAQQTFATAATPYSVIATDINGDGKPDLIVANSNNTVSVLLNTTAPGAATPAFAAQKTFVTGNHPGSVIAADLNGDGKSDLIVANMTDNTVSVLINTTAPGAAIPSFATQNTFAAGSGPGDVTAADVNGDGKPDLIVTNDGDVGFGNTVLVLLNTTAPGATAPTFAAPLQTFTVETDPTLVTAADVNGDGKPDLIVANLIADTVSVLLNTTPPPAATLNFGSAQQFSTGHAHSVATADFNGDGKADLAVLNAEPDNSVSVLLSTTTPGATLPGFAVQQTFAVGASPRAIATRDLNGDGLPDLITANSADNTVSVLLNSTAPGAATPTFATQVTFATGSLPYSVASADFNGDGKPDLVVANYVSSNVSVLFNTTAPGAATPTFAGQMTFATGVNPQTVSVGDVNGDGLPDIIVGNYADATVSVLLNTTAPGAVAPSFATQQPFATVAATHPFAITMADLNGDGRPDIVVTNYSGTGNPDSVSVLLNTTASGAATPSFAAQQAFATGAYAFSVTTADLDGDGKIDLIIGNYLDSTVSVLINTADPGASTPSFAAQRTFGAAYPYSVAIADFNGDGRPDIVAADAFVFTASVLLNTQYQSVFAGSPATGTITHDTVFANGFE
jgi:hypothetical protein